MWGGLLVSGSGAAGLGLFEMVVARNRSVLSHFRVYGWVLALLGLDFSVGAVAFFLIEKSHDTGPLTEGGTWLAILGAIFAGAAIVRSEFRVVGYRVSLADRYEALRAGVEQRVAQHHATAESEFVWDEAVPAFRGLLWTDLEERCITFLRNLPLPPDQIEERISAIRREVQAGREGDAEVQDKARAALVTYLLRSDSRQQVRSLMAAARRGPHP